ncbi:MAG: N-acetylneuraminate lyase [Clostridiaceae bacterium]|nr:N-acetylneuraminate lyase [Clostridiaceae bacterium]
MNSKFRGIFPALLTPFTGEDQINKQALGQLVKMNIDKGVDGFYVGGSTAEAFLMSLDERKEILEIVLEECSNQVTIIAHVGFISTNNAIELAKHAQALGADAISSIPPFYYNFSFDEIKRYYFDLLNAVDLPLIIYNFPSFSGVTFDSANIGAFLDNKRIIGIKHTSSDFFSLERFKQYRNDIIVYTGYDEMFLSGLAAGADGGIGSTYNFMAEKFIEIKQLFDNNRVDEAKIIQNKVNNIIEVLVKVGVFQGEKAILEMMGIPMGNCRKTFKTLTPEEVTLLKETLISNDINI